MGNHSSARAALHQAKLLNGSSSDVFVALACLEARAGNPTEARQCLQQAKELDSKVPAKYVEAPEKIIPDFQSIHQMAMQWLEARRSNSN